MKFVYMQNEPDMYSTYFKFSKITKLACEKLEPQCSNLFNPNLIPPFFITISIALRIAENSTR